MARTGWMRATPTLQLSGARLLVRTVEGRRHHQMLVPHRLQGVGGVRIVRVRDDVRGEPDDAAGDAQRRRGGESLAQSRSADIRMHPTSSRANWLRPLRRTAFVDEFRQRLVIKPPTEVHKF